MVIKWLLYYKLIHLNISKQSDDKWLNHLYLSGCSCCLSDSLIGCVRPGGGPGRTGLVSHVQMGQRWELSPCSSSPSLHGGSRDLEAAGPSGCLFSCWHCDSLFSYTERM